MRSAFQGSVVWYYQELARRIGPRVMEDYLRLTDYGNGSVDGGVDRFWLDGGLRISADRQIAFLRRLRAGDLPLSRRNQRLVRELMIVEEAPDYVIHAKTGLALRGESPLGWWVGWVEQGGNALFFALNMERLAEPEPPLAEFAAARMRIVKRILKDELGAL